MIETLLQKVGNFGSEDSEFIDRICTALLKNNFRKLQNYADFILYVL